MFEIDDDYFAAETLLAEHFEKVDGIKRIYKSRELSEVLEKSQVTPALHLVFYGDNLPDTSNGGALIHIKQTWLIVLAIKNTQKDVGQLLTKVIKSLAGKKVGEMGVWQRINAPIRPSFHKGFSYYPLAFTCPMRMKT